MQLQPGETTQERNYSGNTKVNEEGVGRCAPGAGAVIPLQDLEKILVRQTVLLQTMEVNSGTNIHLQPMKDPHQSR